MSKTIRISQIKLPIHHTKEEVLKKALKTAHIRKKDTESMRILRQSIDARKKDSIHYTYSVEITVRDHVKWASGRNIAQVHPVQYQPQASGSEPVKDPIAIIGLGPAGLFCGYLLASFGYHPVIFERGQKVEQRRKDVENFWQTGVLNTESNVQFGEGGAGTFSDGKLNTLIKDKTGRNRFVLETFVRFGAPSEILYSAKPHIGTDLLIQIVSRMREEILKLGGRIFYDSRVTSVDVSGGRLHSVTVNNKQVVPVSAAVFAVGHSARDTFEMLYDQKIPMEPKPFAVGFRVEHLQKMIDDAQYGTGHDPALPPSPYKLTWKSSSGRGVYTFCMCPGGYVVNASSENERIAVNGMSNYRRDSGNANSAVIITVTPDDYPVKDHPLSGVYFQRELEHKAWQIGQGKVPQQLFQDFEENRPSTREKSIHSCLKGRGQLSNLRPLFTEDINQAFLEAMHGFGHKLHGFDHPDAVLSGVESRTSSPVRMPRNRECESSISGFYPCGEGAGYAGGITSAAMDGLRCAEALMHRFRVPDKTEDDCSERSMEIHGGSNSHDAELS